jgi:hypothetical protein
MATITIPDELKDRAEARAAEAGYASVDEYVAAVLRADADNRGTAGAPDHLNVRSREQLVSLVREGLASPAQLMTPADFDRRRAELISKHSPKAAG